MISRLTIILLSLAFSTKVSAQQTAQKLDDLETLQNLDRAMKAIEDLANTVEKGSAEKRAQCFKAIGHAAFCDCIREKSPVGIDFIQYVAITSRTKADLGYDKLSADDKKMVDAARASREACVGAFSVSANK